MGILDQRVQMIKGLEGAKKELVLRELSEKMELGKLLNEYLELDNQVRQVKQDIQKLEVELGN